MRPVLHSPIHWFGGKGRLVPWLLNFVPSHRYYLEVFGGGASLLFAKFPALFEVYNDLDAGLFSFFKVLRDPEKFKKFYQRIYLTPYSRREYQLARNWQCDDEIERACRWFVLARMSFSGRFNSGWSFEYKSISQNMPRFCSAWLSVIDHLPEIHQRIMRVQIDNLDWRDCLEKYDWGQEEFIYLDPPYLHSTRRAKRYACEMSDEEHRGLVDYLITHKRRVLLSGYDNETYRELESHGFRKYCIEVSCHAAGRTRQSGLLGKGATFKNGKNQRRKECVWINYELPKFRERSLFEVY